jgi:hypothetical protein
MNPGGAGPSVRGGGSGAFIDGAQVAPLPGNRNSASLPQVSEQLTPAVGKPARST